MDIIDIISDTLLDCIKTLPFLFLAYLLMEYVESRMGDKINDLTTKAGKFSPLVGSLLGIIPQCGFSAAASNLYATNLISIGTLCAIYLSTSDEMLPLLLAEGISVSRAIKIVLLKAFIALIFGYLIDLLFNKHEKVNIEDLCEREHCHCEEEGGSILKAALTHTLHIFIFLLIVSFLLNLLIGFLGEDNIVNFIGSHIIAYPLVALIGLIPNCAASVIITRLWLENIISFGAMLGGLLTGSGVGILVLWRVNNNPKRNILIMVLLLLCGIISAFLLDLFAISL